MRRALACIVLIALGSPGCAIQVAAKGLKGLGKVARASEQVAPVRLERARRSATGVYYLFAECSDGEAVVLTHDPAVGEGDQVRFTFGEVPAGAEVPVGNQGGAPSMPRLRFRRGCLERSAGEGYEVVGALPTALHKRRTFCTYLVQGAYSVVAFPLACVADVLVGAVGCALYLLSGASSADLSGLGPFSSNL